MEGSTAILLVVLPLKGLVLMGALFYDSCLGVFLLKKKIVVFFFGHLENVYDLLDY